MGSEAMSDQDPMPFGKYVFFCWAIDRIRFTASYLAAASAQQGFFSVWPMLKDRTFRRCPERNCGDLRSPKSVPWGTCRNDRVARSHRRLHRLPGLIRTGCAVLSIRPDWTGRAAYARRLEIQIFS
jgi:hypothetical protein